MTITTTTIIGTTIIMAKNKGGILDGGNVIVPSMVIDPNETVILKILSFVKYREYSALSVLNIL